MDSLLPSDPAQIDGYAVEGRLGSGGFGVVYAATNADGEAVAIKVLRSELSDDPRLRERLAREAGALRQVAGNRTVKILDVVTEGDLVYLVMERIAGENLQDHVQDKGPLTGPMLWFAAVGLTEALQDIHKAGIIHRDLKPSNIMYGPDGVKVLDFGISVVADQTSLTQTGEFLGTGAWMSPEMIQGATTTVQADVFNLGLVLGFVSSGKHPFGSGRTDALMYRVVNEEPDLSDVPEPIQGVVRRCLDRDPSKRPHLDDLLAFFGSDGEKLIPEAVGAASDTLIPRASQTVRTVKTNLKGRNGAIALGIGLAAAAIATVFALTGGGGNGNPPSEVAGGDTEIEKEEQGFFNYDRSIEAICTIDGNDYYQTNNGVEIDQYRPDGNCDIDCDPDVPQAARPILLWNPGVPALDPYNLDGDGDGYGCDTDNETVNSLRDEESALEELEQDDDESALEEPEQDDDESASAPTATSVPTPAPAPSPVFQSTCSIPELDLAQPYFAGDSVPPGFTVSVSAIPPVADAWVMPGPTGEWTRVIAINGNEVQNDGGFDLYHVEGTDLDLRGQGPPANSPGVGETVTYTVNATVTLQWDSQIISVPDETVTCSDTTTYTRPRTVTMDLRASVDLTSIGTDEMSMFLNARCTRGSQNGPVIFEDGRTVTLSSAARHTSVLFNFEAASDEQLYCAAWGRNISPIPPNSRVPIPVSKTLNGSPIFPEVTTECYIPAIGADYVTSGGENAETLPLQSETGCVIRWVEEAGYSATIAYDGNGGSSLSYFSGSTDYAPYTQSVGCCPFEVPTREGFNFTGWNTSPDGSGTAYEHHDTIDVPAGTTTLFAQWE